MTIRHQYYRAKFRAAPYLPLRGPVHIDLELAGKCQLACTMCNYGIGSFDESMQGMMPKPLAFAALHQARALGALSMKPNFRGEPGLCSYLPDIVREAKRIGYTEVLMNTNLTAFSKRRLRETLQAGIDRMIVSIDGATAETYEAIRVDGDWDKLRALMWYMHDLAKDARIVVQCVSQAANRHEMHLMPKVWGPLCDDLVIQDVQDRGQGEGFGDAERTRCPQPWQRLIVAWDGAIFACCGNWHNEFPLGNLRTMTLQEAWQGERLRKLRAIASKPASGHPCQKCTVKASYK